MIKNMMKPSALLAASAIALSAVAMNVSAQNKAGYLQDTRGEVAKSGFNLCWRTSQWTPALAIAECDPDLVPKPAPKPAAPAAKPAAKPAAPAPKPAPKPAAVSPSTEKVTMAADALFDFNKAVIKPDAKGKLDDLVGKVKGVNLEVVIAIGHADRIGGDAYNNKLSLRRADSVKAYLVSKGIAANRIYTEGKGKKQPVKDCPAMKDRKKLIECLQPNRRVEIEVVGTRAKK
jgi:OOP family OmpA-OmpF porin